MRQSKYVRNRGSHAAFWLGNSRSTGSKQRRARAYGRSSREHEAEAKAIEAGSPGLVINRNGRKGKTRPEVGGACPWQLEGLYNGLPCYVRYRGNTAAMTVWSDEPWGTPAYASTIHGWDPTDDGWRGWVDGDEQVRLVADVVAALAPVSEDNLDSGENLRRAVEDMIAAMKAQQDADA